MGIEERGRSLDSEEHSCGLCRNYTAGDGHAPTVIVLDEDGIYEVQVCDECRRRLCVCFNCTAYAPQDKKGNPWGYCQANAPAATETGQNDFAQTEPGDLCRNDFQQREPLVMQEIAMFLGDTLDDALIPGDMSYGGNGSTVSEETTRYYLDDDDDDEDDDEDET